MMDQNRCLLDVIDNPQLLQSFLESESSAANADNNDHNVNSNANASTERDQASNAIPITDNVVAPYTSYSHYDSTTALSHSIQSSDMISDSDVPKDFPSQTFVTNAEPGDDNDADKIESPSVDPVGSVLDSIIDDTVAEVSPSPANDIDYSSAQLSSLSNSCEVSSTPTSHAAAYSTSGIASSSFGPSRSDHTTNINTSSPELDLTPSYHGVDTGNVVSANDANNNSTSSTSDIGSNELLVDELYSQQMQTDVNEPEQLQLLQQENRESQIQSDQPTSTTRTIPPDDNSTTVSNTEVSPPKESSIDQKHEPDPPRNAFLEETQLPSLPTEQQSQQPLQDKNQVQSQSDESQPQPQGEEHRSISTKIEGIQSSPSQAFADAPTDQPKQTPKSSAKTNTKTTDSKPKRNTSRAKKAKVTTATTSSTQAQPVTTTQSKPISSQFVTPGPGQQQVIFQSNNGIRQPIMMAPSSMAQPIGVGMPQPQRVIQIQTANGPMYFAIAPGPATSTSNNSGMMNQQQSGLQSNQYPQQQQQLCFQPNSNLMMARPQSMQQQMTSIRQASPMQTHQNQQFQQIQQTQHHQQMQSQSQQQQQQQQQVNHQQGTRNMIVSGSQIVQSSQQTRLGSPVVGGQAIAIANQQNPNQQQQQQVMLPSSQPMMIPRMSNQIMINRPMGNTGQLIPGQQQFIQILTPNGPMLLALPAQASQPQQINNSMIDFNSQVRSGQQMQQNSSNLQMKQNDTADGTQHKLQGTTTAKNASNSKSGLDLGDLLLDCGILPDDRAASQSSSSVKSSQSPSLSQISSPMPCLPQTNSPLPPTATSPYPSSHPQQTQHMTNYGQYQGQPIRISMGPDGQMIMQPAVYSAIRPVMTSTIGQQQQPHINNMGQNNMIQSGNPVMTMNSPSPSFPRPINEQSTPPADKKATAKGKGAAVKRSRSKKSDVEKFPQLKTPKIQQQQQQQQQQQLQQQQQQKQTVVVPMSFLVGEQGKIVTTGPDVKPNVGQQAKFVSPVMHSVQSSLGSDMMQSSIAPQTNSINPNQTHVINTGQYSTQIVQNPSINVSSIQHQQNSMTTSTSTTTTSNMSSSGNVTINLLKTDAKSGTVESNPHISSSLMPTISLTVDTLKIEPNGLKTTNTGPIQTHNIKSLMHNVGGLTTTLVLRPAQAQLQHNSQTQAQMLQMQMQQQLARQKEMKVRGILNQLGADQNAALHPQTKQSFESLEDACKRLLRYHVFDTEAISEEKIKKVDELFEAAVESLLTRRQAVYDKFRFLILKQSMKTVPSSEEIMLEQLFVNDELNYLKKERELFREYEAHLESMAMDQARDNSKSESNKEDSAPDYFAFGPSSPKSKNQEDQDNASHSRDVDDWLMTDKWGDSRYPSVPDSEAATAIESILNEELS